MSSSKLAPSDRIKKEVAPPAHTAKVKQESEGSPQKKKRAKKEYEKPGQKKDEPDKLDVVRLFYESLYHEELNEGPETEKPKRAKGELSMAELWCMEHGIFDEDTQEKLYKRHLKSKGH